MARERIGQVTPYDPSAIGGIRRTEDRWGPGGVQADGSGEVIQGNKSGEAQEVDRYRDMSAAMQTRDPYKFDWSQSDQSHAQGAEAGAIQGDAANAWRDQATGQDRTAYNYGQSLLDRGVQNQHAAAASTAGGPLAQMAAMRGASNNEAAFRQRGTNELEAQHADDMATGRAGWANALGQERGMDATAQGLSDQGTELEATAAAQQNKLNDAGSYDAEKMAFDTQAAGVAGRQHGQTTMDRVTAANKASQEADKARTMGTWNAVTNAVPVVGPGYTAGTNMVRNETDPHQTSDERAKNLLTDDALLGPEGARSKNALLGIIQAPAKLSGGGEWRAIARKQAIADGREDDAKAEKAANTGVSGAPKGYSASRRGQPGDMFGGGPSGQGAWASSYDEDHKQAPGTRDFMKYGEPAPGSDEKMDDYSKAVMTSDERAKFFGEDGRAPKEDPQWLKERFGEDPPESKAEPKKEDGGWLSGLKAMVSTPEWLHKERADFAELKKRRDQQPLPQPIPKTREPVSFVRGAAEEWEPLPPPLPPPPESSEKEEGPKPRFRSSGGRGAGTPHRARAGEMTSDEKAKVVPLRHEGDSGIEQHYDRDVTPDATGGASLSGPSPKYSAPREAPSAAKPAPGKPKTRKPTFDELKRQADEMLGNQEAQSKAQLENGPAVSDERAKSKSSNPLIEMQKDANRALRGETYTYKDGFGEDPSRVHHGFMAQNLEKNPITATAVREDETGIKKVDNGDALRVTAAGVASLQDQQDDLERAINALAARRSKKVA